MNFKLLFCTVLALSMPHCIQGSKILFLPTQMKSHVLMQEVVGKEMARRGHDVYFALGVASGKFFAEKMKDMNILWFKQKYNYYQIDDNLEKYISQKIFSEKQDAMGDITNFVAEQIYMTCEDLFGDDEFMDKIKNIKFDFMFVDPFIPSPCNVLLPYNLSVPFAVAEGILLPWHHGVPTMPSVDQLPIFARDNDNMDFIDRFWNLLFAVYLNDPFMFPGRKNKHLLKSFAPGHSDWNSIVFEAELCFVFRNYIIDLPQPIMPNIIYLPGITYKDAEQLPRHLQEVMDKENDGAIIVSFGSQGRYMAEKHMKKIVLALYALPNTVIFTFAGDTSPYKPLPKNIFMFKWIPQNDILGHKNTRLFITHGGLNGLMESIYHAVPMIVVPLFAEQPFNAKNIEKRGLGVTIDLYEFKSPELTSTIKEILHNETYSQNVKLRSLMLRNSPDKHPVNRTADWIEYAMKYGGAHLKSTHMSMPFYKYFMLDILVFVMSIMFILLMLVCKICFKVYKKIYHQDVKVKLKEQ